MNIKKGVTRIIEGLFVIFFCLCGFIWGDVVTRYENGLINIIADIFGAVAGFYFYILVKRGFMWIVKGFRDE